MILERARHISHPYNLPNFKLSDSAPALPLLMHFQVILSDNVAPPNELKVKKTTLLFYSRIKLHFSILLYLSGEKVIPLGRSLAI